MGKRLDIPFREKYVLTTEIIDEFYESKAQHSPSTQKMYRQDVKAFYDWLPAKKEVTQEAVECYRDHILTMSQSKSAANHKITAVNQILKFIGLSEYSLSTVTTLDAPAAVRVLNRPISRELSLSDFKRLLAAAKQKRDDFTYLLMCVVFSVDTSTETIIESVTVENVRKGKMAVAEHGNIIEKPLIIPLVNDLLKYARVQGIMTGPIFRAANGGKPDRVVINRRFRMLTTMADLPYETSLVSIRLLGRKTAKTVASQAVTEKMNEIYADAKEKAEEGVRMGRTTMDDTVLTKENIVKFFGTLGGDEAVENFLMMCIRDPEAAVEEWCERLIISTDEFISASIRGNGPLLAPSLISRISEDFAYSHIRQYVALDIETPGVEVYIQDNAYHVVSVVSREWFNHTENDLNCTRPACRAVGELYREAGIVIIDNGNEFIGWQATLIPTTLRFMALGADHLLVDEDGVIQGVVDCEHEYDLFIVNSLYCARTEEVARNIRAKLEGKMAREG